jgi:hypothetical protein
MSRIRLHRPTKRLVLTTTRNILLFGHFGNRTSVRRHVKEWKEWKRKKEQREKWVSNEKWSQLCMGGAKSGAGTIKPHWVKRIISLAAEAR